jgi:hypothetical protein
MACTEFLKLVNLVMETTLIPKTQTFHPGPVKASPHRWNDYGTTKEKEEQVEQVECFYCGSDKPEGKQCEACGGRTAKKVKAPEEPDLDLHTKLMQMHSFGALSRKALEDTFLIDSEGFISFKDKRTGKEYPTTTGWGGPL